MTRALVLAAILAGCWTGAAPSVIVSASRARPPAPRRERPSCERIESIVGPVPELNWEACEWDDDTCLDAAREEHRSELVYWAWRVVSSCDRSEW